MALNDAFCLTAGHAVLLVSVQGHGEYKRARINDIQGVMVSEKN
jgi:hypothetical protein